MTMHTLPLIAIIGRANAGKSTLFNRLVSRRQALTTPTAGTTRDALEGICEWDDTACRVCDTAGYMIRPSTDLERKINISTESVIRAADCILLMLDGLAAPVEEDRQLLHLARRLNKPVVAVVNKIDPGADDSALYEFYRLGIDEPVAISAAHGTNLPALIAAIRSHIALPPIPAAAEQREMLTIGIVGRPNTGKSTLTNRLFPGSTQLIVDAASGTTRDILAREATIDGQSVRIIDTPGMGKGRRKENIVDHLMYQRTMKLLPRLHLCIYMLDATQRFTIADQKVAFLIKEAGCGCVILLNKWDSAEDRETRLKEWQRLLSYKLQMLHWAPFLPVSALTGLKIDSLKKLLNKTIKIYNSGIEPQSLKARWADAFRNKVFSFKGKPLRFFAIDQKGNIPARFAIQASDPHLVHFSFKRQIENWLRHEYDLTAIPVRLIFGRRKR